MSIKVFHCWMNNFCISTQTLSGSCREWECHGADVSRADFGDDMNQPSTELSNETRLHFAAIIIFIERREFSTRMIALSLIYAFAGFMIFEIFLHD